MRSALLSLCMLLVLCLPITSEKTSTANEQYVTESVYVACACAYVTSEKTSTADEQYITGSVYVACAFLWPHQFERQWLKTLAS